MPIQGVVFDVRCRSRLKQWHLEGVPAGHSKDAWSNACWWVECKAMGRVTKTRHPSCHAPNVHKARFDQQVTVQTSMGENEQRCTWFLKHVQSCWVPRCTSAIPTQRSAKQLLLVVCHAGANMMRLTQNTTRIIDKTPLARSLANF
jgi:hypothetical protein